MLDSDSVVVWTLLGLAAVAVVGLLFLGPVGWLLATFIVVATLALAGYSGVFEAETRTERRNCEHCGAPNPDDSDSCGHCGSAFDEASAAARADG